MKVILTQNVAKLGQIGEVVTVANGYGRNFLLPRKLAVLADDRNIHRVEHERAKIQASQRKIQAAAEEIAGKLNGHSVAVPVRVGEQGKLYGSVNSRDVQMALKDAGFDIDRRQIHLDEAIREIGEYEVEVKLHPSVSAKVKLSVKAEEA